MVRVMINSNKTLKGHRLLFLSPTPVPPEYISSLKSQFADLDIVEVQHEWAAKEAHSSKIPAEVWEGVTILLTGSTLPKAEKAPVLEYVQLLSAGANHVLDNPFFQEKKGVSLCTANGVHGPQISEWIITTYLAFNHHIPRYLDIQREAKWQRLTEPTEDAVGKTVGILGYGSIGRQTARVAKALGFSINAYTLHPRPTPDSRRDDSYTPTGLGDVEGIYPSKWYSGSSTEELHEFLGSGLDLLVIALPLTDKSKGLISKAEFEVLGKHKTFVSNIARGPIVDTDALIDALEGDVIRGAAVDVTDPEPLPEGHPLWTTKNIIVTPHISGASTAYNTRVLEILKLNLARLSVGEKLTNKVNLKEGY